MFAKKPVKKREGGQYLKKERLAPQALRGGKKSSRIFNTRKKRGKADISSHNNKYRRGGGGSGGKEPSFGKKKCPLFLLWHWDKLTWEKRRLYLQKEPSGGEQKGLNLSGRGGQSFTK